MNRLTTGLRLGSPAATLVVESFIGAWPQQLLPRRDSRWFRSTDGTVRVGVSVFRGARVIDLKASFDIAERLENAVPGLSLPRNIAEADMETSSIPAAWLLSGEARVRSKLLGESQDRLAYAVYWECGAAEFKWHYGKDEFLVILSGDVFVTDKNGVERYYGPSDFVFFPAGTRATWRVPNHLRKIAILRSPLNQPIAFMSRVWNKLLAIAGLSSDAGL